MRISPKGLIAVLASAVIVAGGACAHRSSGLNPETSVIKSDDTTSTSVEIDNQGFADLVVYVIPTSGGVRTRLGTALGHSNTVFPIPESLLVGFAELRFIIHPIGGGDNTTTESVTVSPGDQVVLTIPPP